MSGTGRSLSTAEVVAEHPTRLEVAPRTGSYGTVISYRFRMQPDDLRERRLRRTARRQALLLMLASSVVTVLVLYGAWSLLHRLLAASG